MEIDKLHQLCKYVYDSSVMSYNGKTNPTKQINKIKEMIVNINSIEEPTNSYWLKELRSQMSKNLLSFLDIIFKQINLEKNYSAQKLKWQLTLDQISLSHEEELKKG